MLRSPCASHRRATWSPEHAQTHTRKEEESTTLALAPSHDWACHVALVACCASGLRVRSSSACTAGPGQCGVGALTDAPHVQELVEDHVVGVLRLHLQ